MAWMFKIDYSVSDEDLTPPVIRKMVNEAANELVGKIRVTDDHVIVESTDDAFSFRFRAGHLTKEPKRAISA